MISEYGQHVEERVVQFALAWIRFHGFLPTDDELGKMFLLAEKIADCVDKEYSEEEYEGENPG